MWAFIVYGGITLLCGSLLSTAKRTEERGEKVLLALCACEIKSWLHLASFPVLVSTFQLWWPVMKYCPLGVPGKRSETEAQCVPAVMCYTNRCCYNKNACLF